MCAERPRSTAVLLVRGLLVWGPLILGVSGLCALTAAAAHAAEQVFEPGTKHVCVPADSGEGWDCSSGENPPNAPKAPREPRLRSSSEVPAEIIAEPASTSPAAAGPASTAARGEPAVAPALDTSPERPAQTSTASRSSRSVPNYLLAPEARESAPDTPAQPASTATETSRHAAAADTVPVAKPEPAAARETPESRLAGGSDRDTISTRASPAPAAVAEDPPRAPAPASSAVVAAPATAAAPSNADSTARTAGSATAPVTTATATPATVPAPATASAPSTPASATTSDSAAAESRPASTSRALLGAAEFRRLADSRYVIELGSGHSRDAAERSATANAAVDGPIYLLALQRDGESWYLAVWGDFDSVDAARRARAELLAGGATGVGWPRRAGPLKQELGR